MLTQRHGEHMENQALLEAIAHPSLAAKASAAAMTAGGSGAVYFGYFNGDEISTYCAIGGFIGMVIFGTITVTIRIKTYLLLKREKLKAKEESGKGTN